jgi:alpha-tubulin suppressor-like RCC1 family protein
MNEIAISGCGVIRIAGVADGSPIPVDLEWQAPPARPGSRGRWHHKEWKTMTPAKPFAMSSVVVAARVLFAAACRDVTPAAGHIVSGAVSGSGATGVSLGLSGGATATITTDASGNYSFSGLADGSYTVTPSLPGYAFIPPSVQVTVNGASLSGQNFSARSATAWVAIATGGDHTVALMSDGTLWGCGQNSWGQLGDGTTTNRYWPLRIGDGFASIAAGAGFTLAVKADGTLWAWGYNQYGQLGDGTTQDRHSPVQMGSGYATVAAGSFHAAALKTDGTLWAWGNNQYGQLGDGTTTSRLSPVQIGTGYTLVSVGSSHTTAVKADGTLWAWGANAFGYLGDGTTTDRHSPVAIGTGFARVAAGLDHTAAVKTDGTLWAWGGNVWGQLGDGTTQEKHSPVQIGNGFAQVAAGHYRTAAVKVDGTLWTWGANDFGALGNGTIGSGTTGVRRSPDQIGIGFARVAVGEFHMSAVKTSRTLWAWGDNGHGQLGDGTLVDQLSPVQIP